MHGTKQKIQICIDIVMSTIRMILINGRFESRKDIYDTKKKVVIGAFDLREPWTHMA